MADVEGGTGVSRRALLQGAAAVAAAAWIPAFRVPAASAASCAVPPGFPSDVELYQQAYESWARQIRVEDVWTCAPRTPADVLRVADWARAAGYRLRAKGRMHGWSPLTVTPGQTCADPVVLVDTMHLDQMQVVDHDGPAVRVGTGALMEPLLQLLEDAGLGFTAVPAVGDVTVGGVLAIGGHGTGIPAVGEQQQPGHTYGSLSNLVLELTAVVWDEARGRFVLRTFSREDPACAALLVSLGRILVTEVVLRVGANPMLRCRSIVDVPVTELLAAPGSSGRTLERYLDSAGRLEVLWFPFAERPWLKVWELAPERPLTSRAVDGPYNYPFAENMPDEVAALAAELVRGNGRATPLFNQLVYAGVVAGLTATASHDLWGASKDVLLYVRPSTLRVEQPGHVVLVARRDVQRVVSDFAAEFTRVRDELAAQGRYPVNMPVEIRVSGVDRAAETGLSGADVPALSALRPLSGRSDRDTAVWFNVVTLTGTPGAAELFGRLERWMREHYASYGTVRPEWSKGWAYGAEGPWTDAAALDGALAALFDPGQVGPHGWSWAVSRLDALDPHRVFTNPLLDRLLS